MDFEEEGMTSQEKNFESKPKLNTIYTRLLLVLGVFLILVFLVIVLIPRKKIIEQTPRPSIITPPLVIVTATPPLEPTRWASDAAVLKIYEQNKNLASELLNIDLTESSLALPNINTNVTFEK